MGKGNSIRLDAPEGKMLVNHKLKAVGRIVRIRKERHGDWLILDESEAISLDKEWHPEFYPNETALDSPTGGDSKPGTTPSVPSSGDFWDKVHDKLTEGK